MKRLVAVLISCIAICSAHAQVAATAHPHGFTIAGVVVNALNGQPLSDVDVSIGRARDAEAFQNMTSDDSGHFRFSELSSGKYWIICARRGYARQALDQHENFSTAVAIGPNIDSEHVLFKLFPDGVISGSVNDDQNDPVRDAQVMLFRSSLEEGRRVVEQENTVSTDDRGVYRFPHLAAGRYYIAVSTRPWYAQFGPTREARSSVCTGDSCSFVYQGDAPDQSAEENARQFDVAYPITYYAGATDSDSATAIVIKPGDRFTADISLVPVAAVHIHVANASREPGQFTNAVVAAQAFGTTAAQIPAQTSRAGDGSLDIGGIAPGQYELTLESFGKTQETRTQLVDVSGDANVDATGAGSASGLSGTVQVPGVIGFPENSYIRLRELSTGETEAARINPKGDFQFSGQVKPGRYTVEVFNLEGAIVQRVTAQGATTSGTTLNLAGGAVQLTVSLSTRLVDVNGIVLRDVANNDKPIAGAMVVLIPAGAGDNSALYRRDQSDSDGTFTLPDVLPGKYSILAIEKGWDLEWLNPGVLQPYFAGATQITVDPKQKYDVKVTAQ